MIERMRIHRFRGIKTGQLNDLRRFNLFIGPNNSGKTALLELLYLTGTSGRPATFIRDDLIPAATSVLQATTSVRTDFLGVEPLPRLRMRHGQRGRWKHHPAVLTTEGGLHVNLAALTSQQRTPPWDEFRLSAPLPEWGTSDRYRFTQLDVERLALFSLPHPADLDPSMLPPSLDDTMVPISTATWHYLWEPDGVYRWQQQMPIDQLAVWTTVGQSPSAEHVLFYDMQTANAHFTVPFAKWAYRTIPDWHEKIAHHFGEVFPSLVEAKIEVLDAPDGQSGRSGYLRFANQTPLIVDQLGDGARHTFKVLAALIALAETVDADHPGLFLWEEPELGQNPATLLRLITQVFAIVCDKPIQVFVATHSLEMLAHVTRLMQADDQLAQATRIFRTSLSDGFLKTAWFDRDNLVTWLTSGLDPRLMEDIEMPLQFQLHED